jgi:hypothetical protein
LMVVVAVVVILVDVDELVDAVVDVVERHPDVKQLHTVGTTLVQSRQLLSNCACTTQFWLESVAGSTATPLNRFDCNSSCTRFGGSEGIDPVKRFE